jgi:hypothetical protein
MIPIDQIKREARYFHGMYKKKYQRRKKVLFDISSQQRLHL